MEDGADSDSDTQMLQRTKYAADGSYLFVRS